jgi:signal transduction histidine kinase
VESQLAIELAGVGLWELDLASGAMSRNAEFDAVTGLENCPDSLEGFLAEVHPADYPRLDDALARVRSNRGSSLDIAFRIGEGDDRWVVAKARLTDDEEASPRLLGTITRVHEHMLALLGDAQATASEMEHEARAADERVAYVSHELRHPLNAVLGWSRLLLIEAESGAADAQRVRNGLKVITKQAMAQVRLIENLLDDTRSKIGKLCLSLGVVEVRPALEHALTALRFEAEAKAITLRPVFDAKLGAIVGDVDRIGRIFVNLLANAVKFTPRGGCVEIEARRSADAIVVRITDDGEGIATEQLPLVFERFWQGRRAHAAGGIGLGLTIVRELVELHGGSVSVSSEGRGLGSTFEVRLPLDGV